MFVCMDAAGCENSQPLISGSDPVPDSAFTASSSLDSSWGPEKSRITNSGGWAGIWHPGYPATGQSYDSAWIQVSNMYKFYQLAQHCQFHIIMCLIMQKSCRPRGIEQWVLHYTIRSSDIVSIGYCSFC